MHKIERAFTLLSLASQSASINARAFCLQLLARTLYIGKFLIVATVYVCDGSKLDRKIEPSAKCIKIL